MTKPRKTQRIALEAFEATYSELLTLLENMAEELGLQLEGEISRFIVSPYSIRIETEILAEDGTWERSNIYERTFGFSNGGSSN